MEFLACGKPVLAPAHTAMADYIDEELALVIPAGHEHSVWPQDSRILYRTRRHRPDWGALMRAYQESYCIAKHQPERYEAMSQAALERMRSYADKARFQDQLSAFIECNASNAADTCLTAIERNSGC